MIIGMSEPLITQYSFPLDIDGTDEIIDVIRVGKTSKDGCFDPRADVWAIRRGGGFCLSRSRKWVTGEPLPSSRSDVWKSEHRWSIDEALIVAAEEADKLADRISSYLDSISSSTQASS